MRYKDENRLDELEFVPRWPLTDEQIEQLNRYYPQRELNSIKGLREMMEHITKEGPIEYAAEVGCYRGVSTECLAMYCDTLYAIDPWADEDESIQEDFLWRMQDYHSVVPLRTSSPDICKRFLPESFDFVYIDGMHTYNEVVADINAWMPLVKHGGYLCGHDYVDYEDSWAAQWIQVLAAVRDTIGQPHAVYADSSWLWRKPV